MKRALVASATVLLAAGCGGGPEHVTLTARADSGLADAPVRIDLRGLQGGERATLEATWRSAGGALWRSRTPLRADGDGVVRLRGVGGMRFLWAMSPVRDTGTPQGFAPPARGPSAAALTLFAAGRKVATASLSRRVTPPSVRIRHLTVTRDGVSGILFSPPGRARHPAVVAFGGSGGGNELIPVAGLLAAHGYPALALAYFKAPGLPQRLVRLPLEYFARAVRLMRRQPDVDPARVVTMGSSYGGEASLLAASAFPRLIHGAIALVPSATVTPGIPFGHDAWTLRGRALPERTIPVERIDGPVLAQGAGDDGTWDSSTAVEDVERRLAARHFRFPHHGRVYAHAGHGSGIALPYLPTATGQPSRGGSPQADAAAEADLWPRILSFLGHESDEAH